MTTQPSGSLRPTGSVAVRDVALRDGLQLTEGRLRTSAKVELVRTLLGLGVPELEVGSMARPDLVPALADTLEVVAALTESERRRCWVWVATPGHVRRAADAGVRRFQYCLSVTDEHNRANIGRDTEASMAALPDAVAAAAAVGGTVQLCLATTFTCPLTGAVDPDRVLRLIADPRGEGTVDVVLADTLGQAHPRQVGALVAAAAGAADGRRIVFHGHDTWGMGVANTLAAVDAGAGMVDSALGGLGGCPFAPGASGNTATEDVVFALRPDWLGPEAFHALVGAGDRMLAELGETSRSRASAGAHGNGREFDWTLPGA
ncbi:hydroxymethylglutaryl-CoA lyase [Rhodococcus sp. IEGM 1408]|uniref:hydroxymethylglutaryl-CoA lyase n=1 Tax=Rhodococcus sp. IEGM 1408 TaxID=3082220 RepID=UPI00295582D6|nr:hydroxymethylglutaryl-CoA lyase [Rhodococcus sp. IEGM 1408]MDV8001302.1 hydroxymethylglutaryl-CoA lyase [Rhodococcus sp. IEGM 1408]